jgi:hypothetical protein
VRTAGSLLGRTAVKTGSRWSIVGASAAACAPGGLLALACGAGAAIVTWLALDKAFIAIDEYLFRDAMRAEILASVAEQRQALEAAMQSQQAHAIDDMAGAIGGSLDRVFVPARQGV